MTTTTEKVGPPPEKATRAEAIAWLNAKHREMRGEEQCEDSDNYQRKIMLKYPRLVAHLICQSLGYFCPRSAANAIHHYRDAQPFWCEWYAHMADCRLKNWDWRVQNGYETKPKPTDGAALVVEVGRETLLAAFKQRHGHTGYMAEYLQGRIVVLRELNGNGPKFASWF